MLPSVGPGPGRGGADGAPAPGTDGALEQRGHVRSGGDRARPAGCRRRGHPGGARRRRQPRRRRADLRRGRAAAPAVARPRRDRVSLGCKTKERTGEGAWAELRRSLERLGVERLDLYQLHAVGKVPELDACTAPGGALEALVRAREEGPATSWPSCPRAATRRSTWSRSLSTTRTRGFTRHPPWGARPARSCPSPARSRCRWSSRGPARCPGRSAGRARCPAREASS